MVCEYDTDSQKGHSLWAVLILVLMEYGLREHFFVTEKEAAIVLILVLMEYGLRANVNAILEEVKANES